MTETVTVTAHVWLSHAAAIEGATSIQRALGAAMRMPAQRLVVQETGEHVYIVDLHGWSEPLSAACVAIEHAIARHIEEMVERGGTEVRAVEARRR